MKAWYGFLHFITKGAIIIIVIIIIIILIITLLMIIIIICFYHCSVVFRNCSDDVVFCVL